MASTPSAATQQQVIFRTVLTRVKISFLFNVNFNLTNAPNSNHKLHSIKNINLQFILTNGIQICLVIPKPRREFRIEFE